jgi:hypothetical protein
LRARSLRIVVAAAVAVAASVGTSAASSSTPQWQRVPGITEIGYPVLAAGRVWFVNYRASDANPAWSTGPSAPIGNGRLGPWTAPQTILEGGDLGWGYEGVRGDDIVFRQGGNDDPTEWRLAGVELLQNGKVGKPVEITGGAPPPKSSQGTTFVQLPDRTVLIVGIYNRHHENYRDPGACCDVNGQPVNYASLTGALPTHLQLGLDRQGRLWLAWGRRQQRRPDLAQIVQLDPRTLKPVGAPAMIPRAPEGIIKSLICTDTCRLLTWGLDARGKSNPVLWGPGDSASTRIRLPARPVCDACDPILDGRDADGHLVVAYLAGSPTASHYTVGLARGDALGRNLRAAGSVRVPFSLAVRRPVLLTGFPRGVLSAEGLAVIAYYETDKGPFLRVSVVPLRG